MISMESERLLLRNYEPDDLDDFYEYMRLEYTARYDDFEPLTRKQAQRLLNKRLNRDNYMVVVLKENGKVIGDVSCDEEEFDTYVISYDFNVSFEKHGYATEAVRLLMTHIFTRLSGRRIVAECNDDNENSVRLLERLHFRREAYHLEDVSFKNDAQGQPIYVNSYVYAILSREWSGT